MLTLLLLGLVAWVLLDNIGNLEEVGAALAEVSLQAGVLLVLLLLVVQVLIAAQLAITVPGLRMTRAVVAVEGASAVSNTVPGPSGTATRLGMLRSWGFYTDDFARSWLFTSSLTNLIVLVMPIFAVLIVAVEGEISTGIVVLAAIGLAVSATGIVVVWLMLPERDLLAQDRNARGTLRPLGPGGRAPPSQRAGLRRGGRPVPGRPASDLVRTRRAGDRRRDRRVRPERDHPGRLDEGRRPRHRRSCPSARSPSYYTLVRLLTIVNVTPGGVGVVEALYVSGFLAVTGGSDESQIVAGVILFRGLTYAGPIVLGVIALLVWRFRRAWRVPAPRSRWGPPGWGR